MRAVVGVVEHGNSAVLVTVRKDGTLLDRRRIDLTQGLPTHPYHHEGSWAIGRYADSPWAKPTTLPEAIALVERVQAAAEDGARQALDELAGDVAGIDTIAIRICPELPPTIEARIRDTRASNVADTVMYRRALAGAAQARGWGVVWYARDRILGNADQARLAAIGKQAGPPWQAAHKLAAAAAIGTMA